MGLHIFKVGLIISVGYVLADDITRYLRFDETDEFLQCDCPFRIFGCRSVDNLTVECYNCTYRTFEDITLPFLPRTTVCCRDSENTEHDSALLKVYPLVQYLNNSNLQHFATNGCDFYESNNTVDGGQYQFLAMNNWRKIRIKEIRSGNLLAQANITDKPMNIWAKAKTSVNKASKLTSTLYVGTDVFHEAYNENSTIKSFSVIDWNGTTDDPELFTYMYAITKNTEESSNPQTTTALTESPLPIPWQIYVQQWGINAEELVAWKDADGMNQSIECQIAIVGDVMNLWVQSRLVMCSSDNLKFAGINLSFPNIVCHLLICLTLVRRFFLGWWVKYGWYAGWYF